MDQEPTRPQARREAPWHSAPAPRPSQGRFCWSILWGAVLVLAVLWALAHVQSSVTWDQLMHWLNVKNKVRYTEMFRLGLAVTAWCAIARILRDRRSR